MTLNESSPELAGNPRHGSTEPGQVPANIGQRIREYRMLRHATLRNVADKAGISESFLSQLERGLTSASLATLRQITDALGLEMVDLFDTTARPAHRVLSLADRPTLQFGHRLTKQLLTPKPYRHLEVFVGNFEQAGQPARNPWCTATPRSSCSCWQGASASIWGTRPTCSPRATASTTTAEPRTGFRRPKLRSFCG